MKKHRSTTAHRSNTVTVLAEATAERVRLQGELLQGLTFAVTGSEKTQQKFRIAVLAQLSKVQTMLTEMHGLQVVQFWPPGRSMDERRDVLVREVEERISKESKDMGLKMVRYIYGESAEPPARRGRKRSWSDWEI